MSFLVIFIALVIVAFILIFLTKRRFGVLGLALAAGAVLSQLWVGSLTPMVAHAGIQITGPPLESVVAAVVTVTPALLLLFSGSTYRSTTWRVIGGLIFAALAIAFLLDPLGSALVINGPGRPVYHFFVENKMMIISLGLIISLLDVLATKSAKHPKPDKH